MYKLIIGWPDGETCVTMTSWSKPALLAFLREHNHEAGSASLILIDELDGRVFSIEDAKIYSELGEEPANGK